MTGNIESTVQYLDWSAEMHKAWESLNGKGRFNYLSDLHERLFGMPMSDEVLDYYLKVSEKKFSDLINDNYRDFNNESREVRGELARLTAMDIIFATMTKMDDLYKVMIKAPQISC